MYIRKPFLIYDFATASFWISFYIRKIGFFYQCAWTIRIHRLFLLPCTSMTGFPAFPVLLSLGFTSYLIHQLLKKARNYLRTNRPTDFLRHLSWEHPLPPPPRSFFSHDPPLAVCTPHPAPAPEGGGAGGCPTAPPPSPPTPPPSGPDHHCSAHDGARGDDRLCCASWASGPAPVHRYRIE